MVLAYILIGGWEGGGGRMLTKYAMASFITEKTMIFFNNISKIVQV